MMCLFYHIKTGLARAFSSSLFGNHACFLSALRRLPEKMCPDFVTLQYQSISFKKCHQAKSLPYVKRTTKAMKERRKEGGPMSAVGGLRRQKIVLSIRHEAVYQSYKPASMGQYFSTLY